jgi:hypothetical protein
MVQDFCDEPYDDMPHGTLYSLLLVRSAHLPLFDLNSTESVMLHVKAIILLPLVSH